MSSDNQMAMAESLVIMDEARLNRCHAIPGATGMTTTPWRLLAFMSIVAIPVTVRAGGPTAALAVLEKHCVECHGGKATRGGLNLTSRDRLLRGGDTGPVVVPGTAAKSLLILRVTHADKPGMPFQRERLAAADVRILTDWVNASVPYERTLRDSTPTKTDDWWSLQPLKRPGVPVVPAGWARTPIDRFIQAKLIEKGLSPSPVADKRTLLRRVTFDLLGLPPTAAETAAFLADTSPDAFEKVVDRLLASPQYGERWARHWMDVVHYAETHGHDQDRIRPNAWPYRDYLIRAFNEDRPYARFVEEQLAGDVLFPDDPQGIVATGFLATGPWDESSQVFIMENTVDKKIARNLDRDDMVTTALATFTSTTIHCARCHDHKFDPMTQQDYYSLQAVFAGVDKAERPYESDPVIGARRKELARQLAHWQGLRGKVDASLLTVDAQNQVAAWEKTRQGVSSWTVLDPAVFTSAGGATLTKLADHSLLSSGPKPATDTYTITASTPLPQITGVRLEVLTDPSLPMKGPGRQDNGNLHLTEFRVTAAPTSAPTKTAPIVLQNSMADFNQDGWTIAHAVDGNPATAWGVYPQIGNPHQAVFEFKEPINHAGGATLTFVLEQKHGGGHLIGRPRLSVTSSVRPLKLSDDLLPTAVAEALALAPARRNEQQKAALAHFVLERSVQRELDALPAPSMVYAAAADFKGQGTFQPAKTPRPVHVLHRGDVNKPKGEVKPGALSCVGGLNAHFQIAKGTDEGARRAALAHWMTDPGNVLSWRSIANRVWHYHFGRGICDTPNDLGRMGGVPSHPQLIDWLAVNFRDDGGSLKRLHRLILTSAVYQQASDDNRQHAAIDGDNRLLWRGQRTRLDAESVRDAVLMASGKLDRTMGGPSVKQFLMGPAIHVTPTLDYAGFDPDRPENFRRAVYRFVFRTLPDPFLETLDCPDASQLTATRNVSVTALQALSMLNNRFVVRQCEHLAARGQAAGTATDVQVRAVFELVLGRAPTPLEEKVLVDYTQKHGLANTCRVLFNCNEFLFVN
jgi:mono/diheme cytochrome c family protein